jgi:short subunit fatty acid transporter
VSLAQWNNEKSRGLADVSAKGFVQFANTHTLPFWDFVAALIISLFVPSAGGHWAVQGPFTVPAAVGLHASQSATAIGGRLRRAGRGHDSAVLGITHSGGGWNQYPPSDGFYHDELSPWCRSVWYRPANICISSVANW